MDPGGEPALALESLLSLISHCIYRQARSVGASGPPGGLQNERFDRNLAPQAGFRRPPQRRMVPMGEPSPSTVKRLRADLEWEQNLLMEVATGEADLRESNREYAQRHRDIVAGLRSLGLAPPQMWGNLWAWWGLIKRSDGLGTYQERRDLLIRIYAPTFEALDRLEHERSLGTGIGDPATGWGSIDGLSAQLKEKFSTAKTKEDYEAVAHICGNILISLGHILFDPERHQDEGEVFKKDDAKARIERVVKRDLRGSDNQKLRALIRPLWAYVMDCRHSGDRSSAQIAAEVTLTVVTVLRVLFRANDPELDDPNQWENRDPEPWLIAEAGYPQPESGENWEPDMDDIGD
jgi:hypothetical protein